MPPDLAILSTLIGSNYPCLELIFMVQKVFEPLKFDCIYCWIDRVFRRRIAKPGLDLHCIHDVKSRRQYNVCLLGCFRQDLVIATESKLVTKYIECLI